MYILSWILETRSHPIIQELLSELKFGNCVKLIFSENRVYKEFFNLTVSPQRSFVLFSSKDNGSMLRPAQIRDVQKLDKRFTDFLREIDPITNLAGCHPLCELNKPFHLISVILKNFDNCSNFYLGTFT